MKITQSIPYILLVLVLLGGVGLWFAYDTMRDAKNEETKLRTQLAEEYKKTDQLSSLKRITATTKKEKEELEQFLYSTNDEDQIRFISTIEQMGTSTSGAVIETTILELTKGTPATLRGEFTIKGKWSELFHVLRMIEELPTKVVVNRFDIKEGTQDSWSGSVKVELLGIKTTL
jgi:Tfp pilus assembly protein PilO